MTPEMQKAFSELEDAVDVARTNGLMSAEAEAMWDTLCESLDDEVRTQEVYTAALAEVNKE